MRSDYILLKELCRIYLILSIYSGGIFLLFSHKCYDFNINVLKLFKQTYSCSCELYSEIWKEKILNRWRYTIVYTIVRRYAYINSNIIVF